MVSPVKHEHAGGVTHAMTGASDVHNLSDGNLELPPPLARFAMPGVHGRYEGQAGADRRLLLSGGHGVWREPGASGRTAAIYMDGMTVHPLTAVGLELPIEAIYEDVWSQGGLIDY
jgi:hypothetical protein